jgi:hypothetical protein
MSPPKVPLGKGAPAKSADDEAFPRSDDGFDDPVDRFVPGTACAPGATVRHLLQHRAGLWEWQPLYLDRAHAGDAAAAAAQDRLAGFSVPASTFGTSVGCGASLDTNTGSLPSGLSTTRV